MSTYRHNGFGAGLASDIGALTAKHEEVDYSYLEGNFADEAGFGVDYDDLTLPSQQFSQLTASLDLDNDHHLATALQGFDEINDICESQPSHPLEEEEENLPEHACKCVIPSSMQIINLAH
jgi:hypothetical protein